MEGETMSQTREQAIEFCQDHMVGWDKFSALDKEKAIYVYLTHMDEFLKQALRTMLEPVFNQVRNKVEARQ